MQQSIKIFYAENKIYVNSSVVKRIYLDNRLVEDKCLVDYKCLLDYKFSIYIDHRILEINEVITLIRLPLSQTLVKCQLHLFNHATKYQRN